MDKMKMTSLLTLTLVLMLCLSTGSARKNKGKNRKQLPKSPEWKSGSDPGRDERFQSENEGESMRLDCRAKGKPIPKVTWYKDGHVVSPDNGRIEIKKFKLTIASLVAGDKGNYTCIVSNTEGQLEWTFYVDVVVKIWPLEVEGPRNMTVMEGETVQFRCQVLNDPDATIRWLKPSLAGTYDGSNSALSSANYRGKPEFLDNNTEDPKVLELRDVTPEDGGEYRCLAGNVWGLKYSSAYLTVISTTTTTTTTEPPTTTTTTTTTPSTTTTTFSPFFRPGRTFYPVLYTYGPDLYATTTRPPRHHKKDRKDKGNRRKNGRRRKNKKKDRTTPTPPPTTTTTTLSGRYTLFPTSPSTYNTFTTIWNMDDGIGDNHFPHDYTDLEEGVGNVEGDYSGSMGEGEGEGWVSLWTIYIIVGSIAGVILLIGLLAIVIAVCCRRDEGAVYKSTPV